MMKAISEQQSTSLKSGTFVVVVGVKKHNRIAQPRCKVVHVKFSISSGDSDFISGPFSWWCRIKLHKYFVFTTSAKLDLLQSSTHNGRREYRPFSSCLGLTACVRLHWMDGAVVYVGAKIMYSESGRMLPGDFLQPPTGVLVLI